MQNASLLSPPKRPPYVGMLTSCLPYTNSMMGNPHSTHRDSFSIAHSI